MPDLEVVFRVREEGDTDAIARRMEQSLQRVQRTAAEVTRAASSAGAETAYWGSAADQIEAYARKSEQMQRTTERAGLSQRDLRQAIGGVAVALGQANPAITFAALELSRFGGALGGIPPAAAALSVGVVAAAAGIGYLTSRMQEADRASEFASKLDRSVREFDASGMRTQLKAISDELEDLQRKATTGWRGARMVDPGALIGPDVLPEPSDTTLGQSTNASRIAELERQRDALRDAIQRTRDIEYEQGTIRTGQAVRAAQAGPSADPLVGAAERLRREAESAKQIVDLEAEKALTTAKTEADRTQIVTASAYERVRIETEAAAKILAVERQLAQRAIADQTAIAKQLLAAQLAATDQAAAAAAAGRGAGLATYLGGMSETQRLRYGATVEYGAAREDIAAVQATSATRVQELEDSQAWTRALLRATLDQNLISERDYAAQVRALDHELTTAKLQGLQQYQSAVSATLSKAAGDYARYTEQVRALDRDIRETKRGTADSIAEIQQAGMTPAEALADRERRTNEALAEATEQSGADQVEALKRVQEAYKSLALEAARSAKEQEAAGQAAWATDRPLDDWRTTPGRHSEAFRQAWAPTPGGPGSAEWWAGGAWGNNAWSRGASQAATAQTLQQRVQQVGDLIVQAQEKQRNAAAASATQAQRMVDHMKSAATEAARLADELASAAHAQAIANQIPTVGTEAWKRVSKGSNAWGAWDSWANTAAEGYVPGVTGVVTIVGPSGDSGGGYDSGGIVRATGPALVHKNEIVANQEQQARLLDAIMNGAGGGGGGNLTVQVMIDKRTLAGELVVPLQDAVRAGLLQVTAR